MNKRKITYQEKKIMRLEDRLKQAEDLNTALRNENKSLRAELDRTNSTMDKMRKEHDVFAKECGNRIAEAIDARKTYEALNLECLSLKAEYTKKLDELIRDIRRTGFT